MKYILTFEKLYTVVVNAPNEDTAIEKGLKEFDKIETEIFVEDIEED